MSLGAQIAGLFVLSLAVACVSWTVTQEEIFHGVRQFAERRAGTGSPWLRRCSYLLTCHYCFSHYVAAFFIAITGYKLLYANWTGYLIAWFALVWVANVYISGYAWLRQQYKTQKFEAKAVEHELKQKTEGSRIELPPAA